MIISLVMLKGVFHKRIAYLGIAIVILQCSGITTQVGPLFVVAEVALAVWSLGVGLKLFKLGKADGVAG